MSRQRGGAPSESRGPCPGPNRGVRYDAGAMIDRVRAMPGGIRLFLLYALLILAGIGLSLRSVVDQAISAPVSPQGVVVMVLLAYTIFTTTLVLQRKQAARGLALGLASLTIPLVPLLLLSRLIVEAVFVAALGLAPVPRPAAARGPDLPERAVRTGRTASSGTIAAGTVPSPCARPASRPSRPSSEPTASDRPDIEATT